MCLGCVHFRAPHAARKQKNNHNSPNMPPIISFFEAIFKLMKRQRSTIFSTQLNVFCLCYRYASFSPFFINIRHIFICLLQIFTCIYVRLNSENNACFNYCEFVLEGDLVGVPVRGIYRSNPTYPRCHTDNPK